MSTIANIVRTLEENGTMEYTTVVAASASDPAPSSIYFGVLWLFYGWYFRDHGEDASINYDDLTKQAWAYRQISLLLKNHLVVKPILEMCFICIRDF